MILTIGTSPALARTMIFDRVSPDDVNRAAEVSVAAAGKSTNVARVVQTLGEKVLATGVCGGHTGRDFCDDLDRAGIEHDFVPVAPAVRVCITVIDRANHTSTELVQEPPALTPEESDRLWEKLLELVPRAKAAVMSGVLAPQVPVGLYAMICRLARDAGVAAIADARGAELLAAAAERPTLVKPNREELAATLGRAVDSDAAVERGIGEMISRGAKTVAVTGGRDRVYFCDGAKTWRLQPPRVAVVSAIGSGDAFAGGFAVGAVRGMAPIECARLGVACGCANALTPQAGHVDPDRVREFVDQIVVE